MPRQDVPPTNRATAFYDRVANRLQPSAAETEGAFNIGGLVDVWARRRPNSPAVISGTDGQDVLTYSELATCSGRLTAALYEMGVRTGDRVAVSLPQGRECAIVQAGVLRSGAISMPLSRLYGPDALAARLTATQPSVVVCEAHSLDLWRDVTAGLERTPEIITVGEATTAAVDLDRLIHTGQTHDAAVTDRDDPAMLLFTSGTSGPPKGALHAHRVVPGHAASLSLAHNLYPKAGGILWSPADWSWAGGLVNCLLYSWWTGTPIVSATNGPFAVDRALAQLKATGASAVFLPPTALKRMRAEMRAPMRSSLRLTSILTGSEALHTDLYDWTIEYLGVMPNEVYGQTEASAMVGNCSPILPVRPGSIGVPYPGAEVAVLDPDGAALPPGSSGQIAFSRDADSVFLGYWNDPSATTAKFGGSSDRWLLTGDAGQLDDDGYLWFDSRLDDVIITAGYRISPIEVENCLRAHAAVREVAVVGLPDPDRGHVIAAFLETGDDSPAPDVLVRQLSDLVKDRLAPFARPRRIEVVDSLPRTPTGKLRRHELRGQTVEDPR